MADHDHKEIWLQPWCDDCERHTVADFGRTWCQDNTFEDCEECGRKAVRYVLADPPPPKEPAP